MARAAEFKLLSWQSFSSHIYMYIYNRKTSQTKYLLIISTILLCLPLNFQLPKCSKFPGACELPALSLSPGIYKTLGGAVLMFCHVMLIHFCHLCDHPLVTELGRGSHRLCTPSFAICAQLLRPY